MLQALEPHGAGRERKDSGSDCKQASNEQSSPGSPYSSASSALGLPGSLEREGRAAYE
jgi:hypothetical protein